MILHVDMDAFFAAVEQRDNPELKGRPVVVSGLSKRSVVSTASYEARKYGIHSAMPVFQAIEKCPDLIILPAGRDKYARDSVKIMEILGRFSPLVEPVSIDEAFVDVKGCETLFGPARNIALAIKAAIREELDLTCSIGIAPVRFLAKIASDMNKPDGLTQILDRDVSGLIQTLPIERVPGVGKQAMNLIKPLRVKTLGDILGIDPQLLHSRLGKMGQRLIQLAQGIDHTSVGSIVPRKSISSETTLGVDTSDPDTIRNMLLAHSQRVGRDLRKKNWHCRHVSVKIKFSDFKQVTRGRKTREWISSSTAIYQQALALFDRVSVQKKIRLIGVGVSEFKEQSVPAQMALMADSNELLNRQWESVDHAVDSVQARFGTNMIQKANLTCRRLKS